MAPSTRLGWTVRSGGWLHALVGPFEGLLWGSLMGHCGAPFWALWSRLSDCTLGSCGCSACAPCINRERVAALLPSREAVSPGDEGPRIARAPTTSTLAAVERPKLLGRAPRV